MGGYVEYPKWKKNQLQISFGGPFRGANTGEAGSKVWSGMKYDICIYGHVNWNTPTERRVTIPLSATTDDNCMLAFERDNTFNKTQWVTPTDDLKMYTERQVEMACAFQFLNKTGKD